MRIITSANQEEIPNNDRVVGNIIGRVIETGVRDGEYSIDDDIVIEWLPCIFGEGNLEFLQALARSMYDDTRAVVITEFLQTILDKTIEGQKRLKGE